MAPEAPSPKAAPVLADDRERYSRIRQNRIKTAALVTLAVGLTLPFVATVSFSVSEFLVAQFRSRTDGQSLPGGKANGREGDDDLERELQRIRQQRLAEEQSLATFRLEMTLVVAGGVMALMGVLFWTVASSPTSKVLTMCGARPAGATEIDARQLLAGLAKSAGLPTPRLYVINSPSPNAFAAGTDPANSVVAVTQGLLTLLDYRELEAVLAHELSHIGNRDTRLNTVVAAMALFLRLPYLLVMRQISRRTLNYHDYILVRGRGWYRLVLTIAMLPALIYLFIVAPVLATVIRSAISRTREFLADAEAVRLTGCPEGLIRALAKIAGAGSVVSVSNPVISHLYFADPEATGLVAGMFRGGLLATHPPVERRIARLAESNAAIPAAAVEQAVHEGKEFTRYHPPVAIETLEPIRQDEISVLTAGNPMGRVYRVLSATSIYDRPNVRSFIVARLKAGALLVVFDDPGRFRQVLTPDQTFGYMPASVKIQKVDMLPAEIHDPAARAALETALIEQAGGSGRPGRLTAGQIAVAAAVGLTVFAGIFLVMMDFGGH